jgi:hypothetical protein
MIVRSEGEYEKNHNEIKNLEPDLQYIISKFVEIISLYKKYESAMYDGDNEDGGDIIEENKIMTRDCEEKIKELEKIKGAIYTSEYYDYDKIEVILEYFIRLYNFITPDTNCDQIHSQANGYRQLLQNIEIYNNIFHTVRQFTTVLNTNKINNLKKLITKVLQQVNITNKPNLTEGIVIQGISEISDTFVKDLFEKLDPFIQVLYMMTTGCQDPSSTKGKSFQSFLDELVLRNIEIEKFKGIERVYDKDSKSFSTFSSGIFDDEFNKSPSLSRQTSIGSNDSIISSISRQSGIESGSDSGSENGILSELSEIKGGEKTIRTQYEDLQSPFLNQMPYNQQQTQPYLTGQQPSQQQPSQQQPSQQQPSQQQPFGQLTNYNHNEQYNIAKDKKSKLSYYIEIELELYPGTEVNTVQRLAVKCQSQFERIREAWADIFGFQYRPAILKEAYAYQAMPLKNKSDDTKETETDNKELKTGGYFNPKQMKKTMKHQKNVKKNKSIKRIRM